MAVEEQHLLHRLLFFYLVPCLGAIRICLIVPIFSEYVLANVVFWTRDALQLCTISAGVGKMAIVVSKNVIFSFLVEW